MVPMEDSLQITIHSNFLKLFCCLYFWYLHYLEEGSLKSKGCLAFKQSFDIILDYERLHKAKWTLVWESIKKALYLYFHTSSVQNFL